MEVLPSSSDFSSQVYYEYHPGQLHTHWTTGTLSLVEESYTLHFISNDVLNITGTLLVPLGLPKYLLKTTSLRPHPGVIPRHLIPSTSLSCF